MSRYEPTNQQYIFKDTRSGKFYFRGTVNGRFIDISLKTDKISLAKARAQKLFVDPEAPKVTRHTFEEAFQYLLKIQSAKGERTLRQTQDQINHLLPWFKANCPFLKGRTSRYADGFEKQYEEIWADYKVEASKRKPPSYLKSEDEREVWLERNSEPRKLEHDRRYLVMALKRAKTRGWINKDFEKKDFDLLESSEPVGQYLNTDRLLKLIEASKRNSKIQLQVLMAAQMGMRLREILHLRKEEVDLSSREIDLNPKRIKTRKRREENIPISDEVFPLLKKAFHEAPGDFIFPAWLTNTPGQPLDPNRPQNDNKHFWEQLKRDTGIDIRFHDLRHTAITNMLKKGVPDFAVRKICGVSEPTMRRIYAHLDQGTKSKILKAFRGIFVESSSNEDNQS